MSGCRVCSICHLVPPYPNSSRCKNCSSIYSKERYKLVGKERRLARQAYYIKNHVAILARQRKKLLAKFNLEKYGQICDICGSAPKHKSLAIDHCHKTNTFRGFLCDSCNLGLGKFYDSKELLRKAIIYLEKV
jgi:hypothetical protein